MGSIISSGIGSGLDIDGLVKNLVAAEGNATGARLTAKEAGYQAKLSALGSFRAALDKLKSALAPLKEVAKFQGRAVTVGDAKILTATAATNAVPGTYNVEVERLARAHRLASGAFAATDTAVGSGTLRITLGGNSVDVTISAQGNTLADIRNAINAVDGNPGASATIVNESGVGNRLVLSSAKTGATNTIGVTVVSGDAGLSALVAGITTTQTPLDSRIVVNGYVHESATNSVSTAVDGLTFNLLAQSETDVTTPVGVTFDKTAATKAVNDFVGAYNSLVTSLRTVSSFNADTKIAGALFGDATLRDFVNALRREIGTPATGLGGTFATLSEIGVAFQVDGTLAVDSKKLDTFITDHFDEVGNLFAYAGDADATEGVARRLDRLIDGYVKSDGLIDARTKGLQSSIDSIGKSREALNERLAALEKRLRTQFSAMDTLVAQLRSTSNFLTQQVNALNGSATR
jgi:flagellar hook-associated protein 2